MPSILLLTNALALLLVSIWLRCHLLGSLPGINGDEAWYGVQSFELARGGSVAWHTPTGNPLNPLLVGPLALLHLCFPPSFVLLRSVALASGLLTLAINWFLCRWLFDRRTAAVSTVALAILPINIAYSRFAWDASQSLAVTLPVVYCALAATKDWANFGRWIAVASLALAVSVWVHPTNIFAGAAIAAACIARWRYRSAVTSAPANHAAWGIILVFAAILLAAWICAARPNHGLLRQHIAERLGDVQQLDPAGGVSSFAVLYARLFTGGTIYRYIAGSPSWFEWPPPDAVESWGIDVAVFWACLVGAAWILWRRRCRNADSPCAAALDRVLLTAWALQLAAFFFAAGPRAMIPGQERFSISLIATTVLLLARGAVAAWELASRRWQIVLTVATLAAWPIVADFHAQYFRFIQRTGGEAHQTFRTAAVEPKQAALQYILDDATTAGPIWIVATEWWNRWPVRYLASDDANIYVPEPNELVDSDAYRRAVAGGRVWYVEFFDSPAQRAVETNLAGRNTACQTFPDYAGRPLLSVLHSGAGGSAARH